MSLIRGKTSDWQVVIGLEVHAQIISKTKLFSHGPTTFGTAANSNVDWLDMGLPGSLPVLNQHCVDQAIKTGLSLNAKINKYSAFDRKNYFYPDLPTGYQISQFYHPIVQNGYLDITTPDKKIKKIRINRIHIEQDAGKSTHDLDPHSSYIDFNRAGIGLMEIVTEPDLSSPEEAAEFFSRLRTILRYIKTCDGNMEQGSLRADANISLCKPGEVFGTRCEIKNLNSINFLKKAIEYEIERQLDILESGGTILQETRLFNTKTGETAAMRSKEEAEDYRYFPEPNLPPLILEDSRIQNIQSDLPELPEQKKNRFIKEFALTEYDADILTGDLEVSNFYEHCLKYNTQNNKEFPKIIANWIIGELFAALNRDSLTIEKSKISAQHLAELVLLILDGTISGKIAKQVFELMWEEQKPPLKIIEEKDLKQISDENIILETVQKILSENSDKVSQYKNGKDKLFGFFVGTVLKEFKGKANPEIVNTILKKELNA